VTHEQLAYARTFNAISPALRSVGLWTPLSNRQAIADRILAELAKHGLAVTPRCGCGQPVGVCELCDGPRCWRCNPWFDPPRVPCGGCPVCAGRIVGGDGECYSASWRCDPARHAPRAAVPAVVERVAAAIEALCPDPDTEHAGGHCPYREAAGVARQIGAVS